MKKSDNSSTSQIGPALEEKPHAQKWARRTNQQRPLTSKAKNYHSELKEDLNRYRPVTAPALNLSHHVEKLNHNGDTTSNDGTPFKRDAISERAHALLRRLKPKYFPTDTKCEPEHDFDVIDIIQPTDNIVRNFKESMLLTPEERVKKRKIDYEFDKYYKANRIPTKDIE